MDKKNLFKGSTASILFTQEIKDKEKQIDENLNKIIFKKYEIQKKIGKTSSFEIYEGINISDKTPVIIKIESRAKEELYLELEALNLYTFKDLGIQKIITNMGDWGWGIGDWGLGIGPNPQSPIPNPQSPIPIIKNSFM